VSELPRSAPGAYPSARARIRRVTAASHARPQLAGRAGPKPAAGRRAACGRLDAQPASCPAAPKPVRGAVP
jgi:hypothetical protein